VIVRATRRLALALLFVSPLSAACGDSESIGPEGGQPASGGGGAGASASGGAGASASGGAGASASGGAGAGGDATGPGGGAPCPSGVTCIDTFVFTDQRDTTAEGTDAIDAYACSPSTNEAGREIVYRVAVPSDGFLSVAVYDDADTDVDVHILTAFDPSAPSGDSCVARGDREAAADVAAGYVWVVADTWVSAQGAEQAGPFTLDVGFIPVAEGPCAMEVGEMPRVGDGGDHLAMPATGPVVKEAHLVTQAEPAPYPTTATEELAEHYALSQAATKLVMQRAESWAPLEGGDFFGAGIGDPARFPVVDEGWYVNMYWTPAARPPKGTRMILRSAADPARAVVVAAGYETGPSNLSRIGGTTEETHYYLRTEHLDAMTLGIATDPSLPLGPRRCTD
jgi:hypothetical protein